MEQTTSITECPCCKAKLQDGIFKQNTLISRRLVPLIKEYTEQQSDDFCMKCSVSLLEVAKLERQKEFAILNQNIENLIQDILVTSIQSPHGWDYKVLGMATGQSVTGTGVFSEFASSFTDFFGAQSGSYNDKISKGEDICMAQLKLKCIQAGGNAIVGVDVDYAEVGGGKGMLMVCMTGTIVKVLNEAVLGVGKAESITKIKQCFERKAYLLRIVPPPTAEEGVNQYN